ncbi:MAG: ABC transporter ATP-binding protein, partial [Cyanobacteria bacterium P01_F01_bin.153]
MTTPKPLTGIWTTMAPIKGRIAGAIALGALSAATSVGSLLAIPPIAAQLLSKSPDAGVIGGWLGLAVVLVAIAFTSRLAAFGVSHLAAFKLEVILRTAMAEHLARVPLGYVVTHGSGAIKKWMQDDVQSLHAFVADTTPLIGQAYTIPALSLVVMLGTDWRLAIATLGIVPLGMVLIQLAMRDYAEQRNAYDRANEEINGIIIEFVQGMQVVRTFDDGSSSFARLQKSLDVFTQTLREWNAKTKLSGSLATLLFEPLPTLLVITAVGTWLMGQGTLTLPRLLVFLLLAPRLCGAFRPILTLSHLTNQSKAGAMRIGSVLAEPALPQPERPERPRDASVTLSHVTFFYSGLSDGDRTALQDVSLTIPAGTVTALVGASGAGKTTLARLIPRFWDVTEGAIAIG